MSVTSLGEFGLIDLLAKGMPKDRRVIKGIGDDAAVLPYTRNKYLLFKTDMVLEGAHFTRKMPAKAIGYKAMACNISDIAAMGGLPTFAVVSIGLPKTLPVRFVQEMYEGMGNAAAPFKVSIVGGDTTKSPKIIISVALLGEVEKKYLVTRSGARPKDWIFVSGPLGGSLKSGRHLTFTPRVDQARFLVKNFKPSAMMDISDGLAGDLNHILKASKVGARLFEQVIPLHAGASLEQAMGEGEDFELLFTLPAAKAGRLVDWQAKQEAFYFYPIGEIIADRRQKVNARSFTHF